MPLELKTSSMDQGQHTGEFRVDAAAVLSSLRSRVADVLAELGTFSRPSDVQRTLQLDKTLGRQVFKLASTTEALGSASVVPSRTSIGRFLQVAKDRGIRGRALEDVWEAYEVFEKLIETHAGDRATFNSMVSAASGMDEEWHAADAQHRRNAFRAMSHTMGIQAKTRLQLFVINQSADGQKYDSAMVAGFYGFRVLRPLPRVRVDGVNISTGKCANGIEYEPLGLGQAANGHLLEQFSTQPLPQLNVCDRCNDHSQWREISIEHPRVGKIGTSNLLFGSLHRNLPAVGQSLNISSTTSKPVEVLLFDVLKKRHGKSEARPTSEANLGLNERFGDDLLPLKGKFTPEYLGKGASVIATPEIPHYTTMANAVFTKLGWDANEFDAWRIRIEFPIQRSTIVMTWPDPTRPRSSCPSRLHPQSEFDSGRTLEI